MQANHSKPALNAAHDPPKPAETRRDNPTIHPPPPLAAPIFARLDRGAQLRAHAGRKFPGSKTQAAAAARPMFPRTGPQAANAKRGRNARTQYAAELRQLVQHGHRAQPIGGRPPGPCRGDPQPSSAEIPPEKTAAGRRLQSTRAGRAHETRTQYADIARAPAAPAHNAGAIPLPPAPFALRPVTTRKNTARSGAPAARSAAACPNRTPAAAAPFPYRPRQP